MKSTLENKIAVVTGGSGRHRVCHHRWLGTERSVRGIAGYDASGGCALSGL
jgi:hypothetical protein